MKYDWILSYLEDNLLYTPARIAMMAEEKNLLVSTVHDERQAEKRRIRIACGRYSTINRFPPEGDGMVIIKGQAPTPGWFGWRWKTIA